MHPVVSVILVRESAEQLTGSGCCGKLEGDNASLGTADTFAHTRGDQRAIGVLHRAIREFFPASGEGAQVEVVTVDPRNQLYLTARLWWDVARYAPGLRPGLVTALQLFAIPAVVVNGQVLSRSGQVPDPDAICHHIGGLLRRHTRRTGGQATRPPRPPGNGSGSP